MTEEERAKRSAILDEKRNVTSRISETTRYVGFGLMIAYYVIRSAESVLSKSISSAYPGALKIVGICGLAAVLLDYLQYWFGSRAVAEALSRESLDYNKNSFWYRGRAGAFALKQLFAIFGAIVLIILFGLVSPTESQLDHPDLR